MARPPDRLRRHRQLAQPLAGERRHRIGNGRDNDGGGRLAGQAELRAEIGPLVEAVAQLGISEALRQRLAAAESELASLTAAAAPRLKLDPDRAGQQALVAYKRRLLDLGAALQQDTMDRERTRALLGRHPGTGCAAARFGR